MINRQYDECTNLQAIVLLILRGAPVFKMNLYASFSCDELEQVLMGHERDILLGHKSESTREGMLHSYTFSKIHSVEIHWFSLWWLW